MKRGVALCVSLLALASSALTGRSAYAQPSLEPFPVKVVNTPLPVQGTVRVAPGQQVNAFQVSGDTSNQVDNNVYTIPAGKILIIDYLSARATVGTGETVSSIFLSLPTVHFFVVVDQGPIFDEHIFTAAQSFRTALGPYAAPTPIRVRMERSASGTASSFAVTLAGQLVDP